MSSPAGEPEKPPYFNPRPNTLAARRNFGNGVGLQIVNGIAIPPHMRMPLEDGFRTPMGEDYEQAQEIEHHPGESPSNSQCESHGNGHANGHTNGHNSRQNTGQSNGSAARRKHVKIQSPSSSGALTPRLSIPKSLSLNQLSEKLDQHLSWKIRVRYFTWAAFTMNMATGGIANVLYNVPYRFYGIDTIGTVVFLFNLCLFCFNAACISARFYMYPETLKASLTHPTESLFMPASVVSFGTILLNISQYGLYNVGSWLNQAVLVLFWIDAGLAIIASSGTYLMIWSSTTFTIAQMTPIWIFPAYPLLIIGPQAAVLAKSLGPEQASVIIIGGFTLQGIGYLVSLMIYAAYIYRLMTQKLPQEASRPGMFVSVGPSGFTAAALINLASNIGRAFGPDFMGQGDLAAMVLKMVADWVALWIWGLACWFFLVAVGAHISCVGHGRLSFSLPFFSFIFPNTALINATFAVAKAFNCRTLNIFGCVMTIILIIGWFIVFGMMIRAIWKRQIFWPQRQEDRDEGGFKAPEVREGTIGAGIIRRNSNVQALPV